MTAGHLRARSFRATIITAAAVGAMSASPASAAINGAPVRLGEKTLTSANAGPTAVTADYANSKVFVTLDRVDAVNQIATPTATTLAGVGDPALFSGPGDLLSMRNPASIAATREGSAAVSNFCYGITASICSGKPAGLAAASFAHQNTGQSFVTTPSPCLYPSGIATDPGSNAANERTFLACAGSNKVYVYSPTVNSGALLGTASLSTPSGGKTPVPSGVAFNTAVLVTGLRSSTDSVVVVDQANSTISAIDFEPSTNTVKAVSAPAALPAGCRPAQVVVGANPALAGAAPVYVACPGTGQVAVGSVTRNLSDQSTFGAFTATSLGSVSGVAARPFGVGVNNRSSSVTLGSVNGSVPTALAVSDFANSRVLIYPLTNNGLTLGSPTALNTFTGASAPAGGTGPVGVAVIGTNAFIANQLAGNVTVIDPPAAVATSRTCAKKARAAARYRARRARTAKAKRAVKHGLAKSLKACFVRTAKPARKAARPRAAMGGDLTSAQHPLYP